MPSLERVRFTTSGTESTYLALRLARAHTGKTKIVKFREHFHGWHDYVTPESGPGARRSAARGSGYGVSSRRWNAAALDRILASDDDIAAVIVECNGAHYGTFPLMNPDFLRDVREITERHGVVFIMDEVITGFPAVAGRRAGSLGHRAGPDDDGEDCCGRTAGARLSAVARTSWELMAFRDDPNGTPFTGCRKAGTFNAQPVTAAAGIATLEAIAVGEVNARADAMADRLKNGLNEAFIRNEVTGHAHGIASIIHVNLGAECSCDRDLCAMPYQQILRYDAARKDARAAAGDAGQRRRHDGRTRLSGIIVPRRGDDRQNAGRLLAVA